MKEGCAHSAEPSNRGASAPFPAGDLLPPTEGACGTASGSIEIVDGARGMALASYSESH
jgi:hypothetical protein